MGSLVFEGIRWQNTLSFHILFLKPRFMRFPWWWLALIFEVYLVWNSDIGIIVFHGVHLFGSAKNALRMERSPGPWSPLESFGVLWSPLSSVFVRILFIESNFQSRPRYVDKRIRKAFISRYSAETFLYSPTRTQTADWNLQSAGSAAPQWDYTRETLGDDLHW